MKLASNVQRDYKNDEKKKIMRKVWCFCITLILFCSVLLVKIESCEAATINPEIKAILEEAWQKNKEMQSMDRTFKMSVKTGNDMNYTTEMSMTGTGTVFKNKKAKWQLDATVRSPKEVKSGRTNLYIMSEQSGLLVYKKNTKKGWEKEIPQGPQFFKMLVLINPSIDRVNFMASIKDAKVLGKQEIEGKLAQKIEVTIEGRCLEQIIMTLPQENSRLRELDAELIAKMGDIHCTLWITDEGIVRNRIVLTPNLNNLGNILLTEQPITPARKKLAQDLKVTSMEIVSDLKNINRAKDFEIPQEVLKAPVVSSNKPVHK